MPDIGGVIVDPDALDEYVRNNYEPGDLFTQWELEDYLGDHYYKDWIDPDDLEWKAEAWAFDNGWIEPADAHEFRGYHDDNGHTGAIAWCTDPVCQYLVEA